MTQLQEYRYGQAWLKLARSEGHFKRHPRRADITTGPRLTGVYERIREIIATAGGVASTQHICAVTGWGSDLTIGRLRQMVKYGDVTRNKSEWSLVE